MPFDSESNKMQEMNQMCIDLKHYFLFTLTNLSNPYLSMGNQDKGTKIGSRRRKQGREIQETQHSLNGRKACQDSASKKRKT